MMRLTRLREAKHLFSRWQTYTMSDAGKETRSRLLATAVEMLDEVTEKEVSAAEILRRTGIAKGSLYHFWHSIDELIEEAYLVRYSRFVEKSGGVIRDLLEKCETKEQFFAGLKEVTMLTQDPARKANRYERARILGMAEKNEKFRKALGKVQQGLTDLFTEQFQEVQERGWFNKSFDPRAAAVLIQAYTLGKIVDDVVDNQMDPVIWNALIGLIVEKTLSQALELKKKKAPNFLEAFSLWVQNKSAFITLVHALAKS